jgi:hypothetical protein
MEDRTPAIPSALARRKPDGASRRTGSGTGGETTYFLVHFRVENGAPVVLGSVCRRSSSLPRYEQAF